MVSKELRNVLLNNSERMKVGSRPRRVILSHCSRFVGGAEASRPPGGLRAASGHGPPAQGSQSRQWARATWPCPSRHLCHGAQGPACCSVGPWFRFSLMVTFRACILTCFTVFPAHFPLACLFHTAQLHVVWRSRASRTLRTGLGHCPLLGTHRGFQGDGSLAPDGLWTAC